MKVLDKTYRGVAGIYCIENTINGKRYIGSSKSMYDRSREHLCAMKKLKHSSFLLNRSVSKHGVENFSFYIVEVVNNLSILREREQFYIDAYNVCNSSFGYNVNKKSLGVELPLSIIDRFSKKILCYNLDGEFLKEYRSISEARRELKIDSIICNLRNRTSRSDNYIFRYKTGNDIPIKIEKYVDGRIGLVFSKDRKDKIGAGNKGKVRTEEMNSVNREWHLGRKDSIETRIKKSQALKGKFPESRKLSLKKAVDACKIKVNQLDVEGNFIASFDSLNEASRSLNKGRNVAADICACCKNVQKTAIGYKWQYSQSVY